MPTFAEHVRVMILERDRIIWRLMDIESHLPCFGALLALGDATRAYITLAGNDNMNKGVDSPNSDGPV